MDSQDSFQTLSLVLADPTDLSSQLQLDILSPAQGEVKCSEERQLPLEFEHDPGTGTYGYCVIA
jgi:hypothetical protein